MSTVVDSSLVVAALVDTGPEGAWAESIFLDGPVVAPALMPVEVANILRRAALARDLSDDVASQAHADLLDLRVELFPYEPFGTRAWELRGNLSAHDAFFVALAEALDAPLATLDRRLSRSPGPRCRFLLP